MNEAMLLAEKDLAQVAHEFVDRHGSDAPRVLREMAEIADGLNDLLGGEAWRDIANAAQWLLR